jgi:hypothetical protein
LYVGGIMKPAWAGFEEQPSEREAIELFLRQYAYQRLGASADYSRAAAEAIRCEPVLVPERVWTTFKGLVDGGVNPKVNPLAHTQPERWPRCLLCVLRDGSGYRNLVTTTRDALAKGKVEDVHAEIRNIRGIGPKIASFFLRDVAIRYDIEPHQNRDLLQPVDRWILRFVQMLDDKISRRAVGQWMVDNAKRPEVANAGMWYFGARIAPRKFTYTRAFDDLTFAGQLAEEYVAAFRGAIKAWDSTAAIDPLTGARTERHVASGI